MNKKSSLTVLALGMAIALTACNSSSSSSSYTGKSYKLNGIAAVGAPVVGAKVEAICVDTTGYNDFIGSVITDSDGKWSAELEVGVQFPCAIQVSGGDAPFTLHSYADTEGNVNITPLTGLVLAASFTQPDLNQWFQGFNKPLETVKTAIPNYTTALLNNLTNKGYSVPAEGNPFSTAFDADGQGWDMLLDYLAFAMDDESKTYQDLLNSVATALNFTVIPGPSM